MDRVLLRRIRHDDAILSKRIEDGATESTATHTDVSAGAGKVDAA
jgi:hypothetical protein